MVTWIEDKGVVFGVGQDTRPATDPSGSRLLDRFSRTFQVDAVVGHNDSPSTPSHFIAINLKGRIEVIEFPGGDGSKARMYLGPQLYDAGSDLVPVTLSFVDVSGNGYPDMIVHFEQTQIVFVNENGGFRPATSQELPAIQRYLQQHRQ